MAMADPGLRHGHRDALPSISNLELDKVQLDNGDRPRFPIMNGLNISTAPLGSPTTIYSGPPPPYSFPSSAAGLQHKSSGYISPPESTRRSTRDEKDSPTLRKSLPSIQEALGEKTMPYPPSTNITLTPTSLSHPPISAPPSAAAQSFPDAPKGPSNPFSQSVAPTSAIHAISHGMHSSQPYSAPAEPEQPKPNFTAINNVEPRPSFAPLQSPRFPPGPSYTSGNQPYSDPYTPHEAPPLRSPSGFGVPRSSFTFQSQIGNPPHPAFPPSGDPFGKLQDDSRYPVTRIGGAPPYSDSVKRHLDVFDAEITLNEIAEASSRTLDFARTWTQRSHQSQQRSYFPDVLPGVHEIDDMMREANRAMEGLSRFREVIIAQQNALSEQHARAVRGQHYDDEYALHDDYKPGGFAGGDSKKRRGKAAPPGRCHSCNRAETPEWRRGPDGARTLCNACGLHYAKLTRKMGVNKAAQMTGSNLRPKNMDPRSPM